MYVTGIIAEVPTGWLISNNRTVGYSSKEGKVFFESVTEEEKKSATFHCVIRRIA